MVFLFLIAELICRPSAASAFTVKYKNQFLPDILHNSMQLIQHTLFMININALNVEQLLLKW